MNEKKIQCIWRRKNSNELLTFNKIKKQLEKNNKQCNKCNQKVNLELDHIIPITIINSKQENEFQLLCRYCHRRKTYNDLKVIKIMQSLGLVEKIGTTCYSYYSDEERLQYYYLIINIIFESKKRAEYNE